jgi:transcriptional regulator with XRE-family HTH domain
MNKPEWTPKLGLLLESLRIQAGMDLATMARRNMLSTLQVKQLEKGGSSGFYNEDIKLEHNKMSIEEKSCGLFYFKNAYNINKLCNKCHSEIDRNDAVCINCN